MSKRLCLRTFVAPIALSFGAACSLPEPDGTEAAYLTLAESRPALEAAAGSAPEAVVRNALLLSPEVQTAASAVSASADEVRVQRAAIFPSLSLSIGGGLGDASRGDPSVDLTGRQLIMDFGDSARAVTAADLDVQLAYIGFQRSVDQAIFGVLEAYDNVLRLVELTNVRRAQLDALRTLEGLVEEQTRIGGAPQSDALDTARRVSSAEAQLLETELTLGEARDRMVALTGQPRGGRVPAFPVGTCTSPDDDDAIRVAQLELARAEVELDDAEAARAPRVFLEPLARHTIGTEDVSFGVNFGVESDVLQGGALSARVNAARNTRDGAQANVDAARRTAGLDAAALRRQIATGESRTEILTRQIALLEETRAIYRSQYFELGTRQIVDLLDNEDQYYDLQAERINVRSQLTMARVDCAIRQDQLRAALGVDEATLHGLPLSPGDI